MNRQKLVDLFNEYSKISPYAEELAEAACDVNTESDDDRDVSECVYDALAEVIGDLDDDEIWLDTDLVTQLLGVSELIGICIRYDNLNLLRAIDLLTD